MNHYFYVTIDTMLLHLYHKNIFFGLNSEMAPNGIQVDLNGLYKHIVLITIILIGNTMMVID